MFRLKAVFTPKLMPDVLIGVTRLSPPAFDPESVYEDCYRQSLGFRGKHTWGMYLSHTEFLPCPLWLRGGYYYNLHLVLRRTSTCAIPGRNESHSSEFSHSSRTPTRGPVVIHSAACAGLISHPAMQMERSTV